MDDLPGDEATQRVMERMMLAGWIKDTARYRDTTMLELTPEGVIAVRRLRAFLGQNEGKLSVTDLTTFLALITKLPA